MVQSKKHHIHAACGGKTEKRMKKVLITGGSRGIGAATVKKFAESGDKVVFIYNKSDKEAKELSAKYGADCIRADVSDPLQIKAAVDTAEKIMGGIDVLVTSAGVAKIAQICDTDNGEWRRICDTDLSGTFYACREVSRVMVRQHSGSIVTVGSVWGKEGASCEAAYSAAKAGVRGLTKALAKELAPSGITVNCVEPGVIDTDMNSCLSEEDKKALCEQIPAGRFGTAGEVAELIYFLSSEKASYITGQCIGIGGGF